MKHFRQPIIEEDFPLANPWGKYGPKYSSGELVAEIGWKCWECGQIGNRWIGYCDEHGEEE